MSLPADATSLPTAFTYRKNAKGRTFLLHICCSRDFDASATCSEKTPTALFFKYNMQLGPPYQVLVDTNFINFSIKNKVRPASLSIPFLLAFLRSKAIVYRKSASHL